ncbi:MAG: signal peptidase I [Chloroflexi bacterium]|nr:signal peptidase I [Chloroflexota bacterium]
MAPAIPPGSLVAVAPFAGEPQSGDVVVYRGDGGRVIVHRVLRREGSGIVTRGDANDRDDPAPVSPANLIGRVRWVSPFLGRLLIWVRGGR